MFQKLIIQNYEFYYLIIRGLLVLIDKNPILSFPYKKISAYIYIYIQIDIHPKTIFFVYTNHKQTHTHTHRWERKMVKKTEFHCLRQKKQDLEVHIRCLLPQYLLVYV